MTRQIAIALCLCAVQACSTGPSVRQHAGPAVPPNAEPRQPHSLSAEPATLCGGLPAIEGYDYQAQAHLPLRQSQQHDLNDVTILAQKQLLDRLVGATGCAAEALRPAIRPMGTVIDQAGYACARVVVSNADYAAWAARHRDERAGKAALRDSIGAELQRLLGAGTKGEAYTIAVVDVGILADESFRTVIDADIAAAISGGSLKGLLRRVPWDGNWMLPPLPRGLDIAVIAQFLGQGQASDMVQVEVRLRRRDARVPGGESEQAFVTATASRCLLPAPGHKAPPQRVRIDWGSTRPNGSHCAGDALKPKLASLVDDLLHVRVINTWSKGGAMLLWPPSMAVGDRLSARAHAPLTAGDQSWVALESPLGVEQMLVFSSRDPAALDAELGALGKRLGCRYADADAERLHGMNRASRRDVHLDVFDLRVFTTGECAGQVDPMKTLAAERAVAALGVCR